MRRFFLIQITEWKWVENDCSLIALSDNYITMIRTLLYTFLHVNLRGESDLWYKYQVTYTLYNLRQKHLIILVQFGWLVWAIQMYILHEMYIDLIIYHLFNSYQFYSIILQDLGKLGEQWRTLENKG